MSNLEFISKLASLVIVIHFVVELISIIIQPLFSKLEKIIDDLFDLKGVKKDD